MRCALPGSSLGVGTSQAVSLTTAPPPAHSPPMPCPAPPCPCRCGYQSRGWEVMYNGHTGRQLQAQIFLNPTYYQRLKHMVDDKIHSRCAGGGDAGQGGQGRGWGSGQGGSGRGEGRRPARESGRLAAHPPQWRLACYGASEHHCCGGGELLGRGRGTGAPSLPHTPARHPWLLLLRTLQGAGAGADTDATAGGGARARRRAAVWRDGARLYHLARLRILPQGVCTALGGWAGGWVGGCS